jgi:hypothetical protein
MPDDNTLVLGWAVDPNQDPIYWVRPGATPGNHTDLDLVTVRTTDMAAHTAIIAQSGSGKSFFLGRLIEEILIKTKGRCLVIDPNADFRRADEIDLSLWTAPRYNRKTKSGKLPEETDGSAFAVAWRAVETRIRSGGSRTSRGSAKKRLSFSLPSLSVDLLSEEIPPILRTDLYHCHTFVQALAVLLEADLIQTGRSRSLIDVAEEMVQLDSSEDLERRLTEFAAPGRRKKLPPFSYSFPFLGDKSLPVLLKRTLIGLLCTASQARALAAVKYISAEVRRFYFGRLREYSAAGILRDQIRDLHQKRDQPRLDIIDLPSLTANTRLLALSSILAEEWAVAREEWERALNGPPERDERRPTFIVVDEAHHLIPSEPARRDLAALRDQFRSIAAEGRKYGLFLIIVSQRPDKLDRFILGECENRAVMRLNGKTSVDIAREHLGLEDLDDLLKSCVGLLPGRLLLAGKWSRGAARFLYSCARRTVEGGRNLRTEYWATPFPVSGSDQQDPRPNDGGS